MSHWSRLIDAPLAALIGMLHAAARPGARGAGDAHRVAGAAVLGAGADRRARGAAASRARGRRVRGDAGRDLGRGAGAVPAGPRRSSQRADPVRRRRRCSSSPAAWTTSAPAGSPAACSDWDSPSATRRSRWWCRRWGSPPWWRCGSRGKARARAASGVGVACAGLARRRRCSRPWSRPSRRRAGSTCAAMRCRSISCCSPSAARWGCGRPWPCAAGCPSGWALLGVGPGHRRRPLHGPGARLPGRAVRTDEPGAQVALARPRDGDQEHPLARRQPSRAGAGGRRVRAGRRRGASSRSGAGSATRAAGWRRRSCAGGRCSAAGRSS